LYFQDVVSSVVSSESAGDLERVYDVLEVKRGRVVRVLTCLFPKYFAIITRVRQEVRSMDQVICNLYQKGEVIRTAFLHLKVCNLKGLSRSMDFYNLAVAK